MPIEIKMPALSPTMEEGTLAKWMVKEGDSVAAGDLMAEIETDKATMEFEAVDEGVIAKIVVAQGTDGVKVGAVIALLQGEDEAPAKGGDERPAAQPPAREDDAPTDSPADDKGQAEASAGETKQPGGAPPPPTRAGDRVKASPLARRLAAEKGLDLSALTGSGPHGRIVKADVETAKAGGGAGAGADGAASPAAAPAAPAAATAVPDIPHSATKLSNMRKTIARRLTESKQQVPHIYLTVDVRLDALLALRAELNQGLAPRDIKLSVNDLMIKALAAALLEVPACNVMFTPDQLIAFARADISVAVSTPEGLITPVVTDAGSASLSSISTRMKDLAARARDRKLKPEEFTGGTASLSNMGMYGITQFDAVINPPQGMILAVGAGEKRPWVMADGTLGVATVMSATGSFDHRAIDGADGAQLMQAFKRLVEAPLTMLA